MKFVFNNRMKELAFYSAAMALCIIAYNTNGEQPWISATYIFALFGTIQLALRVAISSVKQRRDNSRKPKVKDVRLLQLENKAAWRAVKVIYGLGVITWLIAALLKNYDYSNSDLASTLCLRILASVLVYYITRKLFAYIMFGSKTELNTVVPLQHESTHINKNIGKRKRLIQ